MSTDLPSRCVKDRMAAFAVTGWSLFFAAVWLLFPSLAFAEEGAGKSAATLGDIVCNIKDNLAAYPYILDASSFVIGAFLVVRGILTLKKHAENPGQPQVVFAVAQLLVGGVFLSLPMALGVIQQSIMGAGGTNGNFTCKGGDVADTSGGNVGLDQMMQGFVTNIYKPMFQLMALVSIAMGLTFIVGGLLRAAKTGADPRAADPKGILVHLIIGAIMISIGTVLPDVLSSLFGKGDISSMTTTTLVQWSKLTGSSGNTEMADKTVRAILAFVQIIGALGFIRGWYIVKKAVEGGGQATLPQGFTFIVGGAMAINIDVMLRAMDKTFGTGVMNAATTGS